MATRLVAEALESGVARRGPEFTGVVFHNDCGGQHRSKEFAKTCENLGVTQSMGRTGKRLDNTEAGPFFATIKQELIDRYYRNNPNELHTEIFG